MRVLYDITTLAHIHCAQEVQPAGIFRHTEEMGLAMARRLGEDFSVAASSMEFSHAVRYLTDTGRFGIDRMATPSFGAGDVSGSALTSLNARSFEAGPLQAGLDKYVAATYSPERIYNTGKFDVYHVNWRGARKLPDNAYPTVVLTVYDVIALKNPEWFVQRRESVPIRRYLETVLGSVRGQHAVTVSTESVKRDLLGFFPNISADQVHVVPLGVSDRFAPCTDTDQIDAVRARYGIPPDHRYILCVNTLEPRKNINTAVDAYARMLAEGGIGGISLVLAGAKGWLADDLVAHCKQVAGAARASVVVTGFVDDGDIAPLYSGASLFCYPSLDEGFGLPVLEAMKCGVPVITSDRPPLLEAAGEAAIAEDPNDAEGLANTMSRLLNDGDLAADLRARGLARAATYTWDRSAAAMLASYARARDQRGGRLVGIPDRAVATREAAAGSGSTSRRVVPLGIETIDELEGAYQGERAFIIGDGFDPDSMPVALLGDEFTFAINGFHRHYDGIPWKPTFYVVTRDGIAAESASVLNAVTGSTFLFEDATSDLLRIGPDVIPFAFDEGSSRVTGTGLFDDAAVPDVRGPDRSLAAAVQIAFYLGFSPIYLIGTEATNRTSPDTAGMRAWHLACRDACGAAGTQILNTSPNTLFEIYKRADGHRIFGTSALPEFGREQHAHIEETHVVSTMFDERDGQTRTMIDVGAHRGTSARFFVDGNWIIHCYEPDSTNRRHLTRKYGDRLNLTIDARAVGAQHTDRVPFFASEESAGISSLSAFRSSHDLQGFVDVTTIAEIVEHHQITHIDFLKVDVEGFDLDVLKGVPWERIRPEVIECEYEDAKTLPMGHNYHDIANYLRSRGYAVYVSEWHPVIRYGIRHDWRRVVPYPGFDVSSNSWGNVLAFKHDPGYETLQSAFAALVTVDARPPSSKPERSPAVKPKQEEALTKTTITPKRRLYADAADRLRARTPGVHTLLRFVKRAGSKTWSRHRDAVMVGLVLLVGAVVAGFALDGAWRYAIWTGTVAIMLAVAVLVVAMYAYRVARRQSDFGRRLLDVKNRLETQIEKRDDAQADRSAVRLASLERQVGQLSAVRREQHRDARRIESLQNRLESAEANLQACDAQLGSARQAIVELQTSVADVQASAAELQTSVADVQADAAELRTSVVNELESKLADQREFSNYGNAPGIRLHTRLLTNKDVEHIRTGWLKHFGLLMTDRELRYLAHKICLDEERCEGRLATTIQAATLRSLALLSINSDHVELLEIGTLSGISAGSLHRIGVRAQRTVSLTLIDPLTGYYGHSDKDGQTGVYITKDVLVENLRTLGVPESQYRVLQNLSTDPEVLNQANDRLYDFVLIDGDHSLQGVSNDFELYGPLVRPGGLLIFDDYDTTDWPAIKPYVDDIVRSLDDWLWVGGAWRTAILKKKMSAV